eukprot:g12598.t1
MADDRLYVIKNTFLDIPLLEAEEDIPRSSTAPAPADKRFVHVPPEAVQARSQTRGDQVSAFRGIPEETASDLQSESRSPSAVYPQKTQDSVFERPTPRLNRYVTWDRYETDAADPNALWSGHSQQSNVSMPPKQRSADSSAVSGGHSLQSNVSAPAKNQSVSAPSGQRAYENVWRGHSNVSAPAAGPRVPLQSGANGSSKAASSSTAAQYASARAAVGAAYHGADGNSPLHTAPNSPLHALAAGPTPGALNYNQQYGPYHVDPTALYGQYNPQTHQHQVLVYDNVSPMSGLGGAADRPQFLSAESTPHPGTSGSQTQTAQSLSFRSPRVSGLQEGGGVQEAGPGQNYQDHMTFLYPAAQETITTTSQDHTMHSGSTAELMSNNRGSTSPVLLSSQGGLGSGLVQTTIQAGALGPGDQSPGATSPIVQAGVPVGGGGTLAPGAGAGRREQTPSGGVRSLQDLLAQVGSYDAELMEKLQSQIAKVGGGTDAARGGAAASSTQAPRAGGSAHVPAVGAGVAQNQIPNTGGRPSGPGPIVHYPPQAGEDGGLSPAQYGNPPGIDLGAPGYAGGTASAGVSGGAAAPSHQSQTSRLNPPPPPPGAPRGSGAHAAYSRSVYNNPVGGGGARASAAGATGNDRTSAVSDGYDQGYGNYSKTLLYNNAIGNFGPSNKGYELDGVYGAGGSTNSNNVHERDDIPATPHSLATQKSQTSGAQRITWNVEAKRLKSTDKLCVSPSFSFHVADDVKYRIVLYPLEANSYNKGQGNFRSSKGRGKIVLKCDTAVADLREKQEEDAKAAGKEPADKVDLAQFNMAFRFLIGGPKGRSKFSRPVTNDFADLGTSGLSKDEESWDLVKYCEQGNLLVGVEAVLNDGSPFPLSWSETGTVSRGQSGTISRGQSAALSANGDSRAINARHGGGTRGYQ